ncbi:MAG: SdpI family protein [Patescibacteria group bacterium]|jgi:uncharacterized membrane protein
MKIDKSRTYTPAAIILTSFIVALYFYPKAPDTMATHWGIGGQANGYSSKAFALFFMPVLSLILLAPLLLLPSIDPYKSNLKRFSKYFYNFINLLYIFLFYLYSLTIIWNLNTRFNLIQALVPAFAILFYYSGVLLGRAQRNWFVGIRTPWTLINEKVWDSTHRLASKLFKLTSLISLLGLIVPKFAFILLVVPVVLVSFYLFVYSYQEYQKINQS